MPITSPHPLPSNDDPDALTRAIGEALPASGIPFTVGARAGGAPAVLLDAAAGDAVRMLVIGSTHRAGLGRVLPGPTAARLLGAAACPVAVAPRSFAAALAPGALAERPRVIEVGYDASPESVAALAVATRIAIAASATVRVVAVSSPSGSDAQVASGPIGAYAISSRFDLQRSLHDAVAELRRTAASLSKPGCCCMRATFSARPKRCIALA